jgi:hypothetical protein
MNWKQSILTFFVTIAFLFAGNAIAQTDININNTNLFRLGGNVTVAENQVVENAHAIGGSVIIQPHARVTQSASAIGGNVVLKPGARIDGDAYAIGGKVQIAEGATIGGTKSTFDDRYDERGMMGRHRDGNGFLPMYFFHASFRIFSAILAAILGLILLRTAPDFLPNLAATVRQYPGESGLWGIGAIVALVVMNIFLALTLIGIPLIPLLSLFVSLTSLVGALGISLFIGQEVTKRQDRSSLQQLAIGLLIITALALIPFLGGIVVFFVSLFGLGALITWKLGKAQPPVLG